MGTPAGARTLPCEVLRAVRRLRDVAVLEPLENKGGRGTVSTYQVDRAVAKNLLRQGRWLAQMGPQEQGRGPTEQAEGDPAISRQVRGRWQRPDGGDSREAGVDRFGLPWPGPVCYSLHRARRPQE